MARNQRSVDTGPQLYRHTVDFRRLLKESRLSGAALAERLMVSPNTVSRWVMGRAEVPGPAMAYLRLHNGLLWVMANEMRDRSGKV